MPKYLIEREIPNAGSLSPADLHGIAAKSCGVLGEMNHSGTDIQWVHRVERVFGVIDPTTAE